MGVKPSELAKSKRRSLTVAGDVQGALPVRLPPGSTPALLEPGLAGPRWSGPHRPQFIDIPDRRELRLVEGGDVADALYGTLRHMDVEARRMLRAISRPSVLGWNEIEADHRRA